MSRSNTQFSLQFSKLLVCFLLLFNAPLWATTTPEVTVKSLIDKDSKEEQVEQKPVKQESETNTPSTAEKAQESLEDDLPYDAFDRITPRSSMQGYLKAARARDFELASHYLDYRNLPKDVEELGKIQLAENLSVVLDRTLWVDVDNLSNKPEGKQKESVPS